MVFFQQGGFCLSYKQFSRGVADGLCHRPRKRSRALPSESPLSSASGRRNHGCVTSFFPVQKPALNSHKPRDMKRPSQKNRVTVQSGRTFQRSSLTGAADNNNDCLWLQNTLAFPLRPPHLRSPPPPAHIHTQTLAHTHICSNNGRLCSWHPQGLLPLNSLVIPPAKYPPPNSTFTHKQKSDNQAQLALWKTCGHGTKIVT